ncbi:hypothetical protein CLF_101860 [Clonorchis sinensis]|uniref:Uncharacterized protein n=1 Tax=Clonorchis sinensis TaxID=79923 RepID=G7Y6Q6_CLOSI|nr:hypothetical protein CLF_101860 [Clonorchis sinensis]
MLLLSFYFFLVAPLPKLQTSTAVAQTPRRTVIHSNCLVPGLHSHGPPTKGKLSVTLHPSDSLCQSPSHPDPAATELRIPSPIAAPLTTVMGLSINRSILPEKGVPLALGPKPPPPFAGLRKQLNRVVDKLQVLESRKATAKFKQLIIHGQVLLRQGPNSATGGLPSVAEDTAPQPRWRSRDTDLGFSSRPTKKREGALATRSAKRASYEVDLDRSAESQHSVSRKSLCVRVFGSKEELLNSGRQWSNERFS